MKRTIFIFLLILSFTVAGCGENPSDGSDGGPELGLELFAEGFTAPIVLTPAGDGSGRLFVADQDGRIWVLTAEGQRSEAPFLDLRERLVGLNPAYDERGLLGLAFHPDFTDNGRLFVYYSAPLQENAPEGWNHTSHLSEFRVSETDPDRAEPGSERILLQVDQPYTNHNGGQIAFGPDGYLYVPLGDGGNANDVGTGHPPLGNGQDTSTLLGSILRLDVDGGDPYGIPPDNPFVGQQGREEIWAYGLRNPFRISFDMASESMLYTGDVGQNLFEEVEIITKGSNYGWNIREGFHCFDPEQPSSPPDECAQVGPQGEPLLAPILEYDHDTGLAVIGGYVYRGSLMPELEGHYIFGDWSASFVSAGGKIFDGVPPTSQGEPWSMNQFEVRTGDDGELGAYLLSFGQDSNGELYALTSGLPGPVGDTGKVYKLVPP